MAATAAHLAAIIYINDGGVCGNGNGGVTSILTMAASVTVSIKLMHGGNS